MDEWRRPFQHPWLAWPHGRAFLTGDINEYETTDQLGTVQINQLQFTAYHLGFIPERYWNQACFSILWDCIPFVP
jgi:hypothetical protein